jgi:ABC-type transport system involved in multi-copper enzyme maturation permease subunit
MRGRRAFVVLTLYLAVLSGLIWLIYLAYSSAAGQPFGPNSRIAGKAVLAAVVFVQVLLVTLVGPAFTAASISGEKERQTYDLLRTTLLSAHGVVGGKLFSALSFLFLLLVAAVPVLSIALMLGGVSLEEMVISQLLIGVSAIAYALIGIFYSTIFRTTIASSVATFATAVALATAAPMMASTLVSIFGSIVFGVSTPPWPLTGLLVIAGLLIAMTNLPATIIISEIILLEEGAIFFYPQMIDSHTVYIISPWLGYVVFYSLLAIVLYLFAVLKVRSQSKR